MRFYLLLSTAVVALSSSPAVASTIVEVLGTHAHLPLELKSTPHYDNYFKVAAICALGQEECGLNVGFDKGNNDQNSGAQKCRDKGYSITRSCTAPKNQGAKCPYHPNYSKPCLCPANYTYTTANCPEPKIRGGGECDGKAVTCSCPSTVTLGSNDICNQKCDGNCVSKSNCATGSIPNPSKDICLNNTPPPGTSFNPCNSCQLQTNTGLTEAGNRYYSCRSKNCSDGGYSAAVPSGNICSSVNFCSQTCYSNCKDDNCPSGYSKINNCSYGAKTVNTAAGTTCYICNSCTPKDCSGFLLTSQPDATTTFESCVVGCGNENAKYKIIGCKIAGNCFLDNPYSNNGICYGTLRTWINSGSLIR